MKRSSPITFGTSGWRAVIADQFTFANVRLVVRAIADYLDDQRLRGRPVIVGYDTRFLADRFAREAAAVLVGEGWSVLLTDRDTPTPVVAHAILTRGAAGALNITASHNPPEYNGVKFSPAWGGPALPETTQWIEKRITELDSESSGRATHAAHVERVQMFNPRDAYLAHLSGLIDTRAIRSARLRVVVDVLHGTGRGYLDEFLRSCGCEVTVIHGQPDPLFGGSAPDPSERRLTELGSLMRGRQHHLGLATDGDADRFGVLDTDGTYVTANEVIALVFDYLVRTRGLPGGVARSVATSHLVDAVASHHGRTVYETGVGFKHLGRLVAEGKAAVAGEEAQGLTIAGHVPDKDGILACALLAEMMAETGRCLRDQLNELIALVGPRFYQCVNAPLTPEVARTLGERLDKLTAMGQRTVFRRVEVEGVPKFYFDDGSWVVIRPSGTEPVARLYVDGPTREGVDELIAAGRKLIGFPT